MFNRVKIEFGKLDIFVSNARTEVPTFYHGPMEITLDKWDTAIDSQARDFLLGAREASRLMGEGGRIIAITYAPGGRTGSWQPWVAMGAAKSAMESLCRYFAVALAKRRITVNAITPGWIEDSVLNSLPKEAQITIRAWHREWHLFLAKTLQACESRRVTMLRASLDAIHSSRGSSFGEEQVYFQWIVHGVGHLAMQLK